MSSTVWVFSLSAACRAVLACTVGTSATALGNDVEHRAHVTAADYARAERFLNWNKDRYVVNADVQHHWIGDEDRLWYVRRNAAGHKQFVVVDAESGRKSAAFDHRTIAAGLESATRQSIPPEQLPFSTFRYVESGRAIQLQVADRLWTCQLTTPNCVAGPPAPAANETLSPDGKWAAFVRDHDVWIRPTSGGAPFALTTDGIEHYSYASSPGYSTRRVTEVRHAQPPRSQVLWSPDSRFLLTHRLDERRVEDLFLLQSVPEKGGMRPKVYAYRYAMAGDEHLPLSEPVVIDVRARRKVKLSVDTFVCLPLTFIEKRDAWWSADGRTVYYLSRDRFSKYVRLHRADPLSGVADTVLTETSDTVAHTNANNVFDAPLVRTLKNGDVIWYSQQDGWGHLYYYDHAKKVRRQITRGDWAVRNIVRIEEARERIYFTASGREPGRDPYEQRLYSVQFDGSALHLLTPEEADHAWPHSVYKPWPGDSLTTDTERAQFSPSGRYFVDSYSRPDLPSVLVLRAADGRLIAQLEEADISQLRAGGYSAVEPFTVLAADGKTPIYGNLFRPSTFDPRRKYPVIDAAYPGPQAIRTAKSFTGALFDKVEAQSLADLGFVVITLDGRGTPNRSKAFLDYSYGHLDRASDLKDHIHGLQQLAQRYPYLDLDRVGIDGVSAGGAMAAQAILMYPDFYRVAVAAEGNHDQRGYLAPWGETYIGPVQECDYSASSTLPLAFNLKGKLFLMHGEMDDNISPTLTLRLADALIKANKDFELLIIPNANHTASFASTYFIRRKWDYFVRNLLGTEPPPNYSIAQPR